MLGLFLISEILGKPVMRVGHEAGYSEKHSATISAPCAAKHPKDLCLGREKRVIAQARPEALLTRGQMRAGKLGEGWCRDLVVRPDHCRQVRRR